MHQFGHATVDPAAMRLIGRQFVQVPDQAEEVRRAFVDTVHVARASRPFKTCQAERRIDLGEDLVLVKRRRDAGIDRLHVQIAYAGGDARGGNEDRACSDPSSDLISFHFEFHFSSCGLKVQRKSHERGQRSRIEVAIDTIVGTRARSGDQLGIEALVFRDGEDVLHGGKDTPRADLL